MAPKKQSKKPLPAKEKETPVVAAPAPKIEAAPVLPEPIVAAPVVAAKPEPVPVVPEQKLISLVKPAAKE